MKIMNLRIRKIEPLYMVIIGLIFLSGTVYSQEQTAEKTVSAQELAKKLANPVASLISVPFQNNTDFGIGDANGTRNTLNIQPVVPIKITEGINLITRYVVPVVSEYNITGGVGSEGTGLSDAVVSAFVSPAESKIVWGVGPVFLLPIGTEEYLSTKKWGVGPTAVVLLQSHGWTFGGLANQIWSVAGDEDRSDVSQLFFQPFLTYNWSSGAGLGVNMELTENWEAETTVTYLNPIISAISSFGGQKVSFAVGPRFNLTAPDGAKADLGVRAVVTMIFPK